MRAPVKNTGGQQCKVVFPKVKQVDQAKKQKKTRKSGIPKSLILLILVQNFSFPPRLSNNFF